MLSADFLSFFFSQNRKPSKYQTLRWAWSRSKMFANVITHLSAVLLSLAGNGLVEYHYVKYYFRSVDFNSSAILTKLFRIYLGTINLKGQVSEYSKCSKISNTLKLRTPKIIAENNFQNILKNRTLAFFWKSEFLKLRTQVIYGGKSMSDLYRTATFGRFHST